MVEYFKCPKCPPEGAPTWIITFGDMMSLLLTFFILLLSLSEIKKDDEFRAIIKEVKKAFGMHGGGGRVPSKDDPELTFIERIKAIQLISRTRPRKSNAEDPGMTGRYQQVEKVRDGEIQAVGGRVTFEPGSAMLSPQQEEKLIEVAKQLRGFNTKIRISGHADTGEVVENTLFKDLSDLSFARAKAVHDFLISDKCRIRAARLKLIANSDSERIKWNIYLPPDVASNRRVEIFASDLLVDEVTEPELNTSN